MTNRVGLSFGKHGLLANCLPGYDIYCSENLLTQWTRYFSFPEATILLSSRNRPNADP